MNRRGALLSILAIASCAMLVPSPVFAHLAGIFAYFAKDIDAPTAQTRMLQQQLDSVSRRIEELEPQVKQARAEYYAQSDEAVHRMRFYDVYVGSALGALWAGAQDPIDVLASSELMQKRLEGDLDALTRLARSYQQLQGKEDSLRRYADLLKPFKTASESRDAMLSQAPEGLVSPFAGPFLAFNIAEDWESLRGTTFVLYFNWAASVIADQGLKQVLDPVEGRKNTWELREEVLNALVGGDLFPFMEDARFYIRADHVNFSSRMRAERQTYDLLTVGQMERTGPAGVQYRIEAIYIDGMPIDPNDPDVQREVYQGHLLGINLNPILPEGGGGNVAAFEQHNGYLLFRPR
jgi:hypothetical protein